MEKYTQLLSDRPDAAPEPFGVGVLAEPVLVVDPVTVGFEADTVIAATSAVAEGE